MRERCVRLYVRDSEYGSRLSRFLSGRDRVGLRVERMTDGEAFWKSREEAEADRSAEGMVWLTDDVPGAGGDPGRGDRLFLLDEVSDDGTVKSGVPRRIGYCQQGEKIYFELLAGMGLSEKTSLSVEAPAPGIYGVFSPWGEEALLTAALLSQELAEYGTCLYVSTGFFSMLYGGDRVPDKSGLLSEQKTREDRFLGELFFRMEREDFPVLVKNMEKEYGAALRLPPVAHYRDLWDVKEDELEHFFERISTECDIAYVVAAFHDVREAIPMAECCREFFFLHRSSGTEPMKDWRKYANNERREATSRVSEIVMPDGWETWYSEMEKTEVSNWLSDRRKKDFVSGLWKEERHAG